MLRPMQKGCSPALNEDISPLYREKRDSQFCVDRTWV